MNKCFERIFPVDKRKETKRRLFDKQSVKNAQILCNSSLLMRDLGITLVQRKNETNFALQCCWESDAAMKKRFAILITYENDFDPNLTIDTVKQWISHKLWTPIPNSLKIEEVQKISEDGSKPVIYFP